MEESAIIIPDLADVVEKRQIMEEIYAPDGTLLMKPYEVIAENPLITNRKNGGCSQTILRLKVGQTKTRGWQR
jgi:hypothetical protein